MKPASDFASQFLNKWEPTNTAVFTREEIAALLKHDYISEVNAELLAQLCYTVAKDTKDFFVPRITNCADKVESI